MLASKTASYCFGVSRQITKDWLVSKGQVVESETGRQTRTKASALQHQYPLKSRKTEGNLLLPKQNPKEPKTGIGSTTYVSPRPSAPLHKAPYGIVCGVIMNELMKSWSDSDEARRSLNKGSWANMAMIAIACT